MIPASPLWGGLCTDGDHSPEEVRWSGGQDLASITEVLIQQTGVRARRDCRGWA